MCRVVTDINFQGTSKNLLIENAYGTSKGNAKNAKGISFGIKVYTDQFGFRGPKNAVILPDNYKSAILILGDSVGFGVALEEDETVAGLLRTNFPETKIYNSSVIGYRACDYKNVLDVFLPLHKEIKHVYLLFCLNDLNVKSAKFGEKKHIVLPKNAGFFEKFIILLKENSVISKINAFLRARSKLYILLRVMLTDPQYRYWNADYQLYSKDDKLDFSKNIQPIVEINDYLKSKKVTFTVIVMPYEYQLRNDDEKLKLPQQGLSRFFRDKGVHYIDAMPEFRDSGIASKNLYLPYDPMHFSKKGNEILFDIMERDMKKKKNSI
ncbi:MAG: hypothetical protein ABIH09_04905 [Candidatus Omnitrophota bacterium]